MSIPQIFEKLLPILRILTKINVPQESILQNA